MVGKNGEFDNEQTFELQEVPSGAQNHRGKNLIKILEFLYKLKEALIKILDWLDSNQN